MTLKDRVPSSIIIPKILHVLKITPHRDRARFTLVDRIGREFILDLAPLAFEEKCDWIEIPEGDARPLYLQNTKVNYWHQ